MFYRLPHIGERLLKDAEYVAEQVKKRFGIENIMINFVSPTVGAHSGPGTLALFYMGENR